MEDNTTGKIRFIGIEMPFYSTYNSIYPFNMEGHYSVIVYSVLEKFNWNYEGKIVEGFPIINMTEVFGYLESNVSDVVLYPNPLDYYYFESTDYSHVTEDSDHAIVSSDGSATFESSDFAFVHIYSSWVWLAWVCSFVILTVFWSLSEKNLSKYSKKRRASYGNENGLTTQLMSTYKVFLGQSVDLPPREYGHQRLAVGCFIMGCFVFNAGFIGVLLSKMTLPPKLSYIETYEDILKHPNMKVVVGKNTGIQKSLKGSTDHLRSEIWQQILRIGAVVDMGSLEVDEVYQDIVRGKTILILEEHTIQELLPFMHASDELKMLQISMESVYKCQYAFQMKKNLDTTKARIVKRAMQALFEADIIKRSMMFARWKNTECFLKDPIPMKKLDWGSIRVVYCGLLLGYLISVISPIFELSREEKKTQKSR